MMDPFLQLIIMLIFGGVVCAIAVGKGRNGLGWFFIGFFLGCIGLILVFCFSDLKVEAAKHAGQLKVNRRLKEKFQQERMKNEAFRQHASVRLD